MPDKLITTTGNPAADRQDSLTSNAKNRLLLQDYQLIEKFTHVEQSHPVRTPDIRPTPSK